MRLHRCLALLLLCGRALSLGAVQHGIVARQDTQTTNTGTGAGTTPATTPGTASSQSEAATTSNPPAQTTQTTQNPQTSQTQSSTQTPSASTTSSKANTSTASSNSRSTTSLSSISLVPSNTDATVYPSVTPNNVTSPNDPVPIPLLPQISPGTVLAGVFLLLTGLVYGFIAIRWLLLHNFLSVVYLSSIAITCLIVFVQNPPVSSGTLAGYVVAVIVSSAVIAGLTSPFAELTEGTGCFVGGFCLSMWLMCLTDNGLIRNKACKIVFILVMSVSIGLVGLFKKTRQWGLIACIPFTGATAIVLGIDCFTRVGFKEFWVFVWGINMQIFPMGTTTYPITTGIRAESMCIIVLWLFGLVANTQLWKCLRRKEREAVTDEQARNYDLERLETEAGMRAQLTIAREKDDWEQQYNESKKYAISSDEKSIARLSSRHSIAESTNTMDMIETDAELLSIHRTQPTTHQFSARRSLLGSRLHPHSYRPSMISRASSEILAYPASANAAHSLRMSSMNPAAKASVVSEPKSSPVTHPNARDDLSDGSRASMTDKQLSRANSQHLPDSMDEMLTSSTIQAAIAPTAYQKPRLASKTEETLIDESTGSAIDLRDAKNGLLPLPVTSQILHMQALDTSMLSSADVRTDSLTLSDSKTKAASWISDASNSDCDVADNDESRPSDMPKLITVPLLDINKRETSESAIQCKTEQPQNTPVAHVEPQSPSFRNETTSDIPVSKIVRKSSQPLLDQVREHPDEEDTTRHMQDSVLNSAVNSEMILPESAKKSYADASDVTTPIGAARISLLGPEEIEHMVMAKRAESARNSLNQLQSRVSLGNRSFSQQTMLLHNQRLSRRNSDSASVYLNHNIIGQRLSQQSMGNVFDSHQPKRTEDRPTAYDQAMRMAQFRRSLQNDPKRTSLNATDFDGRRQQMIYEKRAQEQHRLEQDMARQHFGVMLDQTMRSGDGMYLHTQRLNKMQAQARVE